MIRKNQVRQGIGRPMRAVVRECDMNFGVGAQVLTPGRVAIGDRVRLLDTGST